MDFDWSDAKQLWANKKPMNCQESLYENLVQVKAVSSDTKVG